MMATTYIDFTPSASAPFQFQATLDGAVYTVILTWNLFGQRYYVNIYTLDGTRVLSIPLIGSVGSPADVFTKTGLAVQSVSMTAGYFTTQLIYRPVNQRFEIVD